MVCSVVFVACGKKGDPLPPIQMIPAATTELSAVVRGEEILLDLPYPQTTAAGTPLPGLTELAVWQLVWRAPTGENGQLPQVDDRQFSVAARPVEMIAGADLAAAVRGDRIAVRLRRPPPPEGEGGQPMIAVAVKTQGPGGRESAFSNRLSFPLVEAPAPPAGLAVEPTPRGVRVSWRQAGASAESAAPGDDDSSSAEEPPDGPQEADAAAEEAGAGAELGGFAIYRRLATERVYGDPLRVVPPARSFLLDESALFGQRYVYTVTTVARRRPVRVESAFAEEIEVAYVDRFAPPVPAGLVALPEPGRVRLFWQASAAPDLAGYRVYRRGPDSEEWAPLGSGPFTATELVDSTVDSGATYAYRVTAVDERGNESAPSPPTPARVP